MKISKESPNLVVTQQNILAKSLGSNAIPWCLTLSPKLETKADSALANFYENNLSHNNKHQQQQSFPKNWKTWKDSILAKQYLKSFHKNFHSGDYTQMRSFWGIKKCNSPSDIPTSLAPNIRFEKQDCISYVQKNQVNSKEEERIIAFTLRGTLFSEPAFILTHSSVIKDESKTLAFELFQNIMSLEENVYQWHVRGPRLFKSLLFPSPPDIIALQEYDIHRAEACYDKCNDPNPKNHTTTFEKAMRNKGYSGIFFSDPLQSRHPPSGIAIYFKHDKYELCHASGKSLSIHDLLLSQKYRDGNQHFAYDIDTTSTMSNHNLDGNQTDFTTTQSDCPWTITLPCGNVVDEIQSYSSHLDLTLIGPAALNMDMMEYWTPVSKKAKQGGKSSTAIGTSASSDKCNFGQHVQSSLMKPADRRNAGFIRLKERYFPHRIFHIITAHLMTTSRDCSKTNFYPGEVRAREIFSLKNIAHQHVVGSFTNQDSNSNSNSNENMVTSLKPNEKKSSTLILLGDFNTTPDEIDVFSGNILHHDRDVHERKKISIPTGFCHFDQSFLWKDLHLEPLKLTDAFVTVHSPKLQDNDDILSSKSNNAQKIKPSHCTSFNTDRASWIDYIFYTNDTLKICSKSDMSIPQNTIPNKMHGSDHLALNVKFQWKV